MRNAKGTTIKPTLISQQAKSKTSKQNLHAGPNTLHMQWPRGPSYLKQPAVVPGLVVEQGTAAARKVERLKAKTKPKFHVCSMPKVPVLQAMPAFTSTVDTAGAAVLTKPSLNPPSLQERVLGIRSPWLLHVVK